MADPSSSITALSVLDTAVKIGLGALISGITTYVITTQSHKNTMRKAAIDDACALLKEGALKLEKSSSTLNSAIHIYDSVVGYGGSRSELQDATALAISAYNEAKDAKALFFLINVPELATLVMPYLEAVEAIREVLGDESKGPVLDPKGLEEHSEKVRNARAGMLDALGKAYQTIRGVDEKIVRRHR